jgi:hypothetical protein
VGEGRGRWRRLPRRPQTAIASRRRWRGATGEACARAVHGGGAEAGCGVLWQVVVVVVLLLLLLLVMVMVLVLVLVLMLVLVMVPVIVLVRAGRLAAQAGGAPPPHHGALPRARPRAG